MKKIYFDSCRQLYHNSYILRLDYCSAVVPSGENLLSKYRKNYKIYKRN